MIITWLSENHISENTTAEWILYKSEKIKAIHQRVSEFINAKYSPFEITRDESLVITTQQHYRSNIP
mgnify:CR=1 FL=1